MKEKRNLLEKPGTGIVLIILALIVSVFWVLGNNINVYRSAFVGVFFEVLWLPMVICLLLIPLLSLIIVVKKNTRKLFPIISILIITGTILYLSINK